ncbi:MAG: HEAT repeat domain-containing protein [Anaerolineae bacterium]|nr:HEAT repeat domain-containing protein [Anaerolineae bacterium]
MAKPRWQALVEQLQDPDPKVRRKACRRLAAAGNPEALPFLRNLYLQEEDEHVRQVAHDALATFKAMQLGQTSRNLPVSPDTLRRIMIGLAVVFGVSLLLNLAVAAFGGSEDDGDGDQGAVATEATSPSDWQVLIDQIQERLSQAQGDLTNLRAEVEHHNSTSQVVCDVTYNKPQPLVLSGIDRDTFRQLAIIGNRLNLALFQLEQPQAAWERICSSKIASLEDGLGILDSLDDINGQFVEVNTLLQEEIRNPAPTFGPAPTLPPTNTATPEDSPTASTDDAGAASTSLPETEAVPVETEAAPIDVVPTDVPPTETPIPTATDEPEPTLSPEPTQPLPTPNMDYNAVLGDMDARFIILGDLKNNFQTGMLDYWQRALQGEQPNPLMCQLNDWPAPFEWTQAQLAAIQAEGVADAQLMQAYQLLNEGVDLAYQARALYEPSCTAQTLNQTAASGIPLAEDAINKFNEAQAVLDLIRGRGNG